MKYAELIQFEPIVTVKVLTEANSVDQAREDVRTYVVSKRMRDELTLKLIPNLRFDEPADQKGILVVATYGTGKTHLMSLISSIAEHAELVGDLTDRDLASKFEPIAGRFRVIRAEIGATKMALRDIICGTIEEHLAGMGVEFEFPPIEQVKGSNKDDLVRMMAAFETVEPERGLLFVLDELLDYLRSRRDAELILDLSFLRELGEISRTTRFRIMSGVQESLFDNPRFAHAADELMRVRERYEQLRIAREDVAFVVQERLLRKDVSQRDRIREHLQPFTPAFEGMAENLDEFVSLFPVHPAYLRTFERITIVEKRKVLSTLSTAMDQLLDADVPSDDPGLICFDSYRGELARDPANRTIPEVREVLEKADVLRNRVERAMPTKDYVPAALRIIDALAVHRLTTDDVYTPIGATLDELRDDLCLLPAGVPERDSAFIRITLESIVDEIVRSVSGQFITENPDNAQIYLDLRKDIDYDQQVEDRAASLDDDLLDEAYFQALEEVLEQRDAPYVTGYRIWQYELPWAPKNVTRLGYLFMGAPNERSTAQPPRDYYVYFLQPYVVPSFTDEHKADEVFFRLEQPDDEFTSALRRYAGAAALAGESTVTHRPIYDEKRRRARAELVAWLKKHMAEAITVTYKGETKPLGVWASAIPGAKSSVKEQVDAIAAAVLADHFDQRYPGYPTFGATVTSANLGETVKQAIAQIVNGRPTTLGTKALAALGLVNLDNELLDTGDYARALLDMLAAAGDRAVNRGALLSERDPGLPRWGPWYLEPEWLAVTAAALCQLGRLEVGYPSGQIDALRLNRLATMTADELAGITHIAPPKPTPVAQLQEIADLVGIGRAAVPATGANEALVRQLLDAAQRLVDRTAAARAQVVGGVQLWGALIVDRQAERDGRLEALQRVLDDVRNRDSVGKMNHIELTGDALPAARAGKEELAWVETAIAARDRLSSAADYLRDAEAVFGDRNPLAEDTRRVRDDMLELFAGDDIDAAKVAAFSGAAEDLRGRYADEAARAHARDRLDGAGDERKREILDSDTYRDLQQLAAVRLLPDGEFGRRANALTAIGTCKTFDERALRTSVTCPECGYRPQISTGQTARARVETIESELVELRKQWTATVLDSLRSPEIATQVELLPKPLRNAVRSVLDSEAIPSPVTDELVQGINQVLDRFEVTRVTPAEVWRALFPVAEATTLDDLAERFREFLRELQSGKPAEKIRVLPEDEADA